MRGRWQLHPIIPVSAIKLGRVLITFRAIYYEGLGRFHCLLLKYLCDNWFIMVLGGEAVLNNCKCLVCRYWQIYPQPYHCSIKSGSANMKLLTGGSGRNFSCQIQRLIRGAWVIRNYKYVCIYPARHHQLLVPWEHSILLPCQFQILSFEWRCRDRLAAVSYNVDMH